jgi:hypothetical protein
VVVEEQALVEDQVVVEEQALVEDQVVVEEQAPVEDQVVVEEQALVEEQSVVEQLEAEVATATSSVENVSAIESTSDAPDGAGNIPEISPDLPPSSESVLDEAFESDTFSRLTTLSESLSNPPLLPHEIPDEKAPNSEPASDPLLPSQARSQEIIAEPQEDPGDLFQPMPMPSPVGAAAVGEGAASEPDISLERATMTDATRSVPQPAASDPLAAVRNLSEEELIALFT